MNTRIEDSKFFFKIVDGPNRETIIDAFKYAYDDDSKVVANFAISLWPKVPNPDQKVRILAKTKDWRVTSIQHEDGSGYSCNLGGYVKACLRLSTPERGVKYLAYRFKAYYNAKNREGTIELTEC